MVTVGEDYTTMETIKETGGVVPDATWPENFKHFKDNIQVAKDMGLALVTFHAGFLPHEPSDPNFAKLMDRIRQIGELFGEHGIRLGFETGQETAETLKAFLDQLAMPNVGVNFDPANMILYDKGDPIEALKVLAPTSSNAISRMPIAPRKQALGVKKSPLGPARSTGMAFSKLWPLWATRVILPSSVKLATSALPTSSPPKTLRRL